jgi:hypothetical protein
MLAATAMAVGLSIAGCAIGPDYRKPSMTLEGFHSSAVVRERRTSTPAPAG